MIIETLGVGETIALTITKLLIGLLLGIGAGIAVWGVPRRFR